MTPEQKEAFRREVLEEAAVHLEGKRSVFMRDAAAVLRALAASQPAPAANTGQAVGLTLADIHRANIERQEAWCPDQKPDLSFRGNELAGEVGEACNVIKKLERERHGWAGSRDTLDHLAEELADVVICADLCAVTAGVDLQAAVIAKWNATSEKVGLPHRLAPAHPAPLDAAAEIERLTKERDAAIEANYRQAHCIQQCSAHLGVDYSGTLEGLPLAVKAVVSALKEAQKPIADTGQAVDGPERLWLGAEDEDHDHAVWFMPDEGGTPYIRADLAHPAPLDAERVREAAIREAAKIVAKRRDEYVQEHGSYDPSTGVTEFPGDGEELVLEWDEIEEEILAALRQKEGGQ